MNTVFDHSPDETRVWLRQSVDNLITHRETAEAFAKALAEFKGFAQRRPLTRPGWEEVCETEPLPFVIDPHTTEPHTDALLTFVDHITGACRREEQRLENQIADLDRKESAQAHADAAQHPCTDHLGDEVENASTMSKLDDLRGHMPDVYDPEDVNTIFGLIHVVTGLDFLCVWDSRDDDGDLCGNSRLYVRPDCGRLHELVGDLWAWLNGDPNHPDTPASPGSPRNWIGEPTTMTLDDFHHDDMRHNALRAS